MVPLFHRGHARAGFGYNARSLMAQHQGQRHPHVAGHDVEVAMAGAVGGDFYPHFSSVRRSEPEVFDDQGFARFI